MNLFRTTTFQLTVLYALMLAVSTVAVGIFLYWATIGFLQRQTDSTIEVEIAGLREQYRLVGLNGLSRAIGNRIRSGDDPEALYLFADRQLRPLAGNVAEWPDLVSRADGWYSFSNDIDGQSVPARARVLALPEGLGLLVGRDISDLDRLLKLVGTALAWGAGLVIALSLAGGAFMSSQVLRRVESINATTRSIITGDLSQRLNEIHIVQGKFPFFGCIGPDGTDGIIAEHDRYGENGGNALFLCSLRILDSRIIAYIINRYRPLFKRVRYGT